MLVRINRIAKHVAKGARYFSTAPSSKTGVSCDLPAQSIDSIGCSPLVQQLVDSIEKLSLLETAALVRTLKVVLEPFNYRRVLTFLMLVLLPFHQEWHKILPLPVPTHQE